MMQTISIDSGVLAAPKVEDSSENIYEYVDTLLDWQRLLGEPWVSVHLTERASELLVEEGLYPLRLALQEVFKMHGIVEYDVNTVAQVAERLLRLTPTFEAYFRVRDVLLEQLETEPSLLSLTVGENMAADLGRCVVLMAILRQHCREVVQSHRLILKKSPASGLIIVRAIIHDIEHDRKDLGRVPTAPESFEGQVLACHDFRGLLLSIDEVAAWQAASDEIGKEVAIRIAVYKSRLTRGLDPAWDDVPRTRFGRNFFQTADRVCRANPEDLIPKLLRSVMETAERVNIGSTHALRENQSGGAPQRRRGSDGASAWRRDVDYEYHLHYWECPDGMVELASLGPHNDFAIPE